MSDFKQAVEEILAAKTAGGYCKGLGCLKDEATGKYLSCVECQTYRILAVHNKRLDEIAKHFDRYKEKNANNVVYIKHEVNQKIEKCQAYIQAQKGS